MKHKILYKLLTSVIIIFPPITWYLLLFHIKPLISNWNNIYLVLLVGILFYVIEILIILLMLSQIKTLSDPRKIPPEENRENPSLANFVSTKLCSCISGIMRKTYLLAFFSLTENICYAIILMKQRNPESGYEIADNSYYLYSGLAYLGHIIAFFCKLSIAYINLSGPMGRFYTFDSRIIARQLVDENISLDEISMVPFYNRTRYMLSSCGRGRFDKTDTVFIDAENELPFVREDEDEIFDYLYSRKNQIFIIDCDDIASAEKSSESEYIPCENEFAYFKELFSSVEEEYKQLSQLSILTVGILHPPAGMTAEQVEKQAYFPCHAVLFDSYYDLDLSELNVSWTGGLISENGSEAAVYDMLKSGKPTEFGDLWTLLEQESGCDSDLGNVNYYFMTVLKEMLFEPSAVRRVMLGFDYIEFVMRVFSIYFCSLRGNLSSPADYEIPSNFSDIARQIILNIRRDDPCYEHAVGVYPLPPAAAECIERLRSCFGYVVEDSEYDLCGSVSLLREIRNRTRGHGAIKEDNGGAVWNFLVCMIFFIHRFFDISDFEFVIKDGIVSCGYGGDMRELSGLIIAENDMPCIPIRTSGGHGKRSFAGNAEYINFFSGRYLTPEALSKK